tara:strand:+ start:55 stop:477 length:423 start_codon:yes stop_codon:yes gene_type:complete
MSKETERAISVRASDVLLDHVYNPAQSADIGRSSPARLAEACGLIPDFFCRACIEEQYTLTLENIAAGMDSAYGFGGFGSYSYAGTVDDHDGYQSEHEYDDPLPPLARFIFEGFECLVYDYGIAAIRDSATRETKIARFN